MTTDTKYGDQKKEARVRQTVEAVNKASPFQPLKLANTTKDTQRKR